jgi:hypothetical protein
MDFLYPEDGEIHFSERSVPTRSIGAISQKTALFKYIYARELSYSCAFIDCWPEMCGLVVRVPGYRYRVPGMIPGATRFSEQ